MFNILAECTRCNAKSVDNRGSGKPDLGLALSEARAEERDPIHADRVYASSTKTLHKQAGHMTAPDQSA